MLRHLLKLIWKRKSRNMMLSLEIMLAFLVVFGIVAFAVRHYQLFQLPTGYAWRDQWTVSIRNAKALTNDAVMYDNLKRGLLDLPEVESVAFSSFGPYEMSRWTGEYSLPDGSGKVVIDGETKDQPQRYRITGVVDQFRSHGELMEPVYFMLPRFIPGVGKEAANSIILKLKPGTTRMFEAKLSARLKQLHSDWNVVITPLTEGRKSMLAMQMVPLKILSVIAAFLLVMVAFGLFGVLWQNTTQRIPEIGLRRALGADAGHIYRQIISEQMLLSSGAIAVAMVLLVQLPLTGVFGDNLNWPVFLTATALSASVIYLLSLLCSLYPGWRAARLSPTQALHYE
jgi:putative ABC transport system permease protein